MSIRLLVIVGPNAAGKTRLGIRVAHALGSEIVSADSRQVYRGLNIGAGKDLEEYRQVSPAVPHHLIDVAAPSTIYSLFHYQRDCYRLLERKAGERPYSDGVPLVLVGGTGLYVEAVLRGYRIANVPEDEELRERLMQREHEELTEELRRLDPALAEQTDCSSKKRVVRALEIADHARRHAVRYSEPPPVTIEQTRTRDGSRDVRLRAGVAPTPPWDGPLHPARLPQRKRHPPGGLDRAGWSTGPQRPRGPNRFREAACHRSRSRTRRDRGAGGRRVVPARPATPRDVDARVRSPRAVAWRTLTWR